MNRCRVSTVSPPATDRTPHTTLGSAKTECWAGLTAVISRASLSSPWNTASDLLSLSWTRHHSPKLNQTQKARGISPFPLKNSMCCIFYIAYTYKQLWKIPHSHWDTYTQMLWNGLLAPTGLFYILIYYKPLASQQHALLQPCHMPSMQHSRFSISGTRGDYPLGLLWSIDTNIRLILLQLFQATYKTQVDVL